MFNNLITSFFDFKFIWKYIFYKKQCFFPFRKTFHVFHISLCPTWNSREIVSSSWNEMLAYNFVQSLVGLKKRRNLVTLILFLALYPRREEWKRDGFTNFSLLVLDVTFPMSPKIITRCNEFCPGYGDDLKEYILLQT